jgi:hypothetical protein
MLGLTRQRPGLRRTERTFFPLSFSRKRDARISERTQSRDTKNPEKR